jgi:cytidyltransferase-like protein
MIIGMTSGCFDLIHFGHIHYLQRCRALCGRLIVAIDSDKMVKEAKGSSRPVIPERERLELVNSLGCVDAAFIIDHLNDLGRAAGSFGVGKLFKHEGFNRVHFGHIYGTEFGAELVIVPDVEGLSSTTEIIGRIRERMP